MGPIIAAAELRDRLEEVTVLDVRYRMGGPSGPGEHEAGHVPGAAYVDLDRDLAAPPGAGGRHPLPPAPAFEAAMRSVGVCDTRPVVVYDDWSGHAAARCWWLLRHHGHTDVRVLDGGWSSWVAAGGAAETGPVTRARGDVTLTGPLDDVVEAGDVLDVAVLVDARASERYRGEVETIDAVAGHVPGAVNIPTSRNLADDGRFRTAAELATIYAEVGAVPGADVGIYCGSGVTAAHDLLALELAGVRARLYPGSWSGWITDPGRPVERSTSARL